jgi:hypothetical protein
MVHVMGFPRAFAAVARLPGRKKERKKEINFNNPPQSMFRASVDVTSTFP